MKKEDGDKDEADSEEMVEDEEEEGSTIPATPNSAPHRDQSRKAYDKAFKSVLASSDVLLYVLDARDPMSTRSHVVEEAVTASSDKRLILVLNKIDLVPADILKSWLTILRRSFPTLPFRAASSAPNAKAFDHKRLTPQFTASTLIRALKTYAATAKLQRAITVGVLGYPNVGKSSIINALTSRLSGKSPAMKTRVECPVGAEAGVTTALREVKLDGKLKLLDSPGIVFPTVSPTGRGTPSQCRASPSQCCAAERYLRLDTAHHAPALPASRHSRTPARPAGHVWSAGVDERSWQQRCHDRLSCASCAKERKVREGRRAKFKCCSANRVDRLEGWESTRMGHAPKGG